MTTINQDNQPLSLADKYANTMIAQSNNGFQSSKNFFVQVKNQQPEFHIPVLQTLPLPKIDNGHGDTVYKTESVQIIPLVAIGTYVLIDPSNNKPILTGLYSNGYKQNIPSYNTNGLKQVSHIRVFGYIKPKGCDNWLLAPFVVSRKGQTQRLNKILLDTSIIATEQKKKYWGDTIITINVGETPTIIKSKDGKEQSGVFLVESNNNDIKFVDKKTDVDIPAGIEICNAWIKKMLNNYEIPL